MQTVKHLLGSPPWPHTRHSAPGLLGTLAALQGGLHVFIKSNCSLSTSGLGVDRGHGIHTLARKTDGPASINTQDPGSTSSAPDVASNRRSRVSRKTAAEEAVFSTSTTAQEAAPAGMEPVTNSLEAPKKRRVTRKKSTPPEESAPPSANNIIAMESASQSSALSSSAGLQKAPTGSVTGLQPGPAPGGAWDKQRHWVVFSDLHVSEKTLPTCLQVLQKVHNEATRLNAGIIFLGDFWDERAFIPVEPLNAVMAELAQWTRPMLMLVGNHDQVDLGGCTHALTPLATAWPHRVHVFTEPALYRGALWLPYRRDQEQLKQALRMGAAQGACAVMAHADVQTARYNYQAQSREGVPPELFPQGLPVYTGHYHLPHTVTNTNITYVGSPYQVTASEAGESKRLHVLDAEAGWKLLHTLPIDAGPRHVRVTSSQQLSELIDSLGSRGALAAAAAAAAARDAAATADANTAADANTKSDSMKDAQTGMSVEEASAMSASGPQLRAGDRVKLSLVEGEVESSAAFLREMADRGISVELSLRPSTRGPRMAAAEDRPVLEMLAEYGSSVGMSPEALRLSTEALKEAIEQGGLCSSSGGQNGVDITFTAVTLEGYGPFQKPQTFPLSSRGLRVISGRNVDDVGSDSNGAGKTCLTCAPLWALTGDLTARSEGAGRGGGRQLVDLMLHDGSREGRVQVEGRVNGAAFQVERVIKRGKTARLSFSLDGADVTQADIARTQERIRDTFNTQLLSQTVFMGQNDVANILEANDAAFKELLGRVVEMKIWESARGVLVPQMSALREQLKVSEAEIGLLKQQVAEKEEALVAATQHKSAWDVSQQERINQLRSGIHATHSEVSSVLLTLAQEESTLTALHKVLCDSHAEAEEAARKLEPPMEASSEVPPCSPQALEASAAAASHASTTESQESGMHLVPGEEHLCEQLAKAQRLEEELERRRAQDWEVELQKRAAEDLEQQQLKSELLDGLNQSQQAVDLALTQLQAKTAEVAAHSARKKLLTERLNKYRSGFLVQGNIVDFEGQQHTHFTPQEAGSDASPQHTLATPQSDSPTESIGPSAANGSLGAPTPSSKTATPAPSSITATPALSSMAATAVPSTKSATASAAIPSVFSHEGVKPVCDQCLQEIDEEKYLMNLRTMEGELQLAEGLRSSAVCEEQRLRQLHSGAAELVLQAKLALDKQVTAMVSLAERRQRADKAAADASREDAQRAAKVLRERQREAEEKLKAALWDQRRKEEEAKRERERELHKWQQAVQQARLLQNLRQAAETGLDTLSRARVRWSAHELYQELILQAISTNGAPATPSDLVAQPSRSVAPLQTSHTDSSASFPAPKSVTPVCEHMASLSERCDQLLHKWAVSSDQLKTQLSSVNPYASQVQGLADDLGSLRSLCDKTEERKSGLAEKQAAFKEAEKAMGRGGIRSFVLEGVLGDLQAKTSSYLEMLSGTMTLELLATQPTGSSSSRAKKSVSPRSRSTSKARGRKGEDEAAEQSSSNIDAGASKEEGEEEEEDSASAFASVKEEIVKLVKVRQPVNNKKGADVYTQRSLAQLSGGERRRVALALSLGFVELARHRGRLSCNLLVLDEILQHLDSEGCARVADVLRTLPQETVLVVGQSHSFVTSIFDIIDHVVKENGTSRVEHSN